jgi:hypothetical protein
VEPIDLEGNSMDIGIAWARFGSKDPDYELEMRGDGREEVNPVRRLYLRIKRAT